jgi:FMN-dependent NADH-azoreductase
MKNVLLITSSPRGELSHSSKIAKEIAQSIGGRLIVRELWREPLAQIGPEFIEAVHTPSENLNADQRKLVAPSEDAIAELLAADVLIIAAGMINFGMPASLKSWIDHITRNGATFQITENGYEGLVTGKRAILVLASGGIYTSGPMAGMNHLESALRTNLGFLGVTDIETVAIEGVAYGEEAIANALQQAGRRSQEVLASVR